jgi:uncharacterized membrane protein
MWKAIGILTAITFMPGIELRGSIPAGMFGMKDSLSWPAAVAVCLLANVAVGIVVFEIMGPVFSYVRRWGWFERRVWQWLEKTRHRVHPYVEKYGEMGLAVFIGVPLPGTGVYSGALGAYLLGMDRRRFNVANVLGVLIAGAAVTGLCLLLRYGMIGEGSWLAKLFLKLKTS